MARNLILDTEMKPDAIHVSFKSQPIGKIFYFNDDSSWSFRPTQTEFDGFNHTVGSRQAAEYLALVVAHEMDGLGFLPD